MLSINPYNPKMNSKAVNILLFICLVLVPDVFFAQSSQSDHYGGRLDMHLEEGTGFFRLGEINGKHFLLTPEGNAFRSIGINHMHMMESTEYDTIVEDLKSLGFNSGDYQGPTWIWNRFPYSKGINLVQTSNYLSEAQFKFEDVFDPAYLERIENMIKAIVIPQAENDMLIGYFLTAAPVWVGSKYGKDWISFFKSLSDDAPGKIEWDAWKAAHPDAPEEDFIPLIARQVYSQGTALIRKYDRNHLIFSDRYLEWFIDRDEKVVRESLPYVDAIAFQAKNFNTVEKFNEVFEKYKKPIFLPDHVTSHATDEYPETLGQVADNAVDYLDFYRTVVYNLLSLPYVIGYNKCQYMDELSGSVLKQGLYNQDWEPCEYMNGLYEAHSRALDTAYAIPPNPDLDRFGGSIKMSFGEGTGYFRLGEMNGKHFLVTPDGNAFRSIGINHTHMITSTEYDTIIADLKSMGFNSGDYQGPQWMWNRIPYSKGIQLLKTSTWLPQNQFKFEDVFDPVFLNSLEIKIKSTVQPQVENEMLTCYFLTDVPVWEIEKHGKGWIDFYKSLDKNSPGGIEWSNWKTDHPNSPEKDFICLIARQLYKEATGMIRKYDKNHLIFSDRYIEYHFPENVVYEALPYVDGIAIQPKNHLSFEFLDEVYTKYKRPVFIADHVTSYPTDEYSNTMGQVAENVEDYLEIYRSSVYDAMSQPYIVGYNKCQYMDQVNGTQLKQGLYRWNGEPYEYLDSLYEVHQRALDTAYTVPPFDMEETARKLQDWGGYENIKREAIERIEKYRKGDAHLQVFFSENDTVANTRVRIKLKRHDFKWGAVIRSSFFTSPYSAVYKENFLKYFNATGFGIEMKPKWRGSDYEETVTNVGMPWLLDHDIYVRGHTLAWEGINFIRPEDKAIYDNATLSDQEKGDSLLKSCGIHFSHAIPKWDVKCWDVSNEPIANNLINDLLPDYNTHVHWFKLADSIRRECGREDVKLYQNDYQIISAITSWALNFNKDGYTAVGRPALYREILDEQCALGAPIEGIGFQSRLKHGLITPDSIYKRLCDFDRFNLPYQATEFEIRDNETKYVYTDQERSLLTEYMMVMNFSHPKVNGFWHWTFADVRDNVNWDYDLFNYDGTPKVNARIWMELMDGFFNTGALVTTDAKGEVDVRGYYGSYEVVVEKGNDVFAGTFNMDSTLTDSVIEVYLDRGFSLSGFEDSFAYNLDQPIHLEISAFSTHGDISSIRVSMNGDSIGGSTDATLSVDFTPTSSVEGWNECTVSIKDEQGNSFSHSMDVYFGDTLPKIEILSPPNDTIIQGSTGNKVVFRVSETYGTVDSIIVIYAGNDTLLRDTSGVFEFSIDGLSAGDHHFIVEAVDNRGGKASDTVSFTVVLPANILPLAEITAPEDSSTIYYGSQITLAIEASDSDGTIYRVELYINNSLSHTFYEGPYNLELDTLSVGVMRL
jgi:GH35 family endo-1,4-beta-xylanase